MNGLTVDHNIFFRYTSEHKLMLLNMPYLNRVTVICHIGHHHLHITPCMYVYTRVLYVYVYTHVGKYCLFNAPTTNVCSVDTAGSWKRPKKKKNMWS